MPIFANRVVHNIFYLFKNIYMLVMLLTSQNKIKVCQTFNVAFKKNFFLNDLSNRVEQC